MKKKNGNQLKKEDFYTNINECFFLYSEQLKGKDNLKSLKYNVQLLKTNLKKKLIKTCIITQLIKKLFYYIIFNFCYEKKELLKLNIANFKLIFPFV